MVLAHVVDAWTWEADRNREAYWNTVFVAGLAAPLFMLLAGAAVSMSAASRGRKAGDPAAGARSARARGVEVFLLSLLFRVQSQLLGWGRWQNLLKVDILNVMGLSMIAAAGLWQAGRTRAGRLALFALCLAAIPMATPLVRGWTWLDPLPDFIEAYIRPAGGLSAFVLFPWAGFLIAGALVGELADATREGADPRPLQAGLLVAGAGGAWLAWWLSFQPSIYAESNFWTSSPTFFFLRLGIITALIPAAWAHYRFWIDPRPAGSPVAALVDSPPGRWNVRLTEAIETMGRSSLFVYWVHVEMVYGVAAKPLARSMPLEAAMAATVLLNVGLYWLVIGKNRWMATRELPRPMRIFAAVLK